MNHKYFSFWQNSRRLTILVVGTIFAVIAFPAFAQVKPKTPKAANGPSRSAGSRITFNPRDRKPASGNSRSSGSRGCPVSNNIPMTQLAPQTFVGKTASTRPMLVWYMSNSQPVRFRLYELESGVTPKQIGTQTEISATVGINKLKLKNEYPELVVGKTYLWQVATDCENDVIVSRAEFTVVNAQSNSNKNELWYEALEEALEVTNNDKISAAASTLIQNLAQLEISMATPDNIENVKQRAEYLQKISGN